MIDGHGARKYRAAAEDEARAAAVREDYDTWLRAIGRIAAVDYCLSDEEDLAPASKRIPFPLRKMNLTVAAGRPQW